MINAMAQEAPGLIHCQSFTKSVDFNLYLELYDAVDFEKVVLKASKEDLSQQVKCNVFEAKYGKQVLNSGCFNLFLARNPSRFPMPHLSD